MLTVCVFRHMYHQYEAALLWSQILQETRLKICDMIESDNDG